MSSRAYSSRSKDFTTAGSRCCPAFVNDRAWGLRSNSCTPTRRSSAMTWRDNALWEISNAFAAAVKLPCFATPSKARNAFKGSQRRSMLFLLMARSLQDGPRLILTCRGLRRTRGIRCLFSMWVANFSGFVRPARYGSPMPDHKIASIRITHHRLPLDHAFIACWDSKPRAHFDATLCARRRSRAIQKLIDDIRNGLRIFPEWVMTQAREHLHSRSGQRITQSLAG